MQTKGWVKRNYEQFKKWFGELDFPVQILFAVIVAGPIGSIFFITWLQIIVAYAKWLRNFI